MTVQDLIDELNKVADKTKLVRIETDDSWQMATNVYDGENFLNIE